jgi:hypothetical protein
MTKIVLVSLAVLTLVTSTALAATQQKTHAAAHRTHHHATTAAAAAAAPASPGLGAPGSWWGGPTPADHQAYLKNLHDSGLDRASK